MVKARVSICRDCGAEVVWALNINGRLVPLEAHTFDPDDPDLRRERGGKFNALIPVFDEYLGHRMHFDQCSKRRVDDTPPPADPYAVLFVLSTAPPEVVKAAYRALSLLNHPDRGGDARKMQDINAAFDSLRAQGRV